MKEPALRNHPDLDTLHIVVEPSNMKHNHQPFEHYEYEPKDRSNLYVGIAVGAMIIICAFIYVGVSYMEAVMY